MHLDNASKTAFCGGSEMLPEGLVLEQKQNRSLFQFYYSKTWLEFFLGKSDMCTDTHVPLRN